MADKPIDLGKLQDALKLAQRSYDAQCNVVAIMKRKADNANMAADSAIRNRDERKILLDKAKQAMIDGARSVAQG